MFRCNPDNAEIYTYIAGGHFQLSVFFEMNHASSVSPGDISCRFTSISAYTNSKFAKVSDLVG